ERPGAIAARPAAAADRLRENAERAVLRGEDRAAGITRDSHRAAIAAGRAAATAAVNREAAARAARTGVTTDALCDHAGGIRAVGDDRACILDAGHAAFAGIAARAARGIEEAAAVAARTARAAEALRDHAGRAVIRRLDRAVIQKRDGAADTACTARAARTACTAGVAAVAAAAARTGTGHADRANTRGVDRAGIGEGDSAAVTAGRAGTGGTIIAAGAVVTATANARCDDAARDRRVRRITEGGDDAVILDGDRTAVAAVTPARADCLREDAGRAGVGRGNRCAAIVVDEDVAADATAKETATAATERLDHRR